MMTIFAVMVAVVSIWEYPQALAKRPQVANRFGMVATTCDEEEPASVPAKDGWGASGYVSFAVVDEVADYCDQLLRGRAQGK